jgi:hypothetical protein
LIDAKAWVDQYLFNTVILLEEFEGCLRSDARNFITVITPTQNTQVNKLVICETKTLQYLGMHHLLNGLLLTSRESELFQQVGCGESQSIHIFGTRCKHLHITTIQETINIPNHLQVISVRHTHTHRSCSCEYCALCFCFSWSFDDRHSHESQQRFGVFIVLSGHLRSRY